MTELINDEAVYRTDPATPGLLTCGGKTGQGFDLIALTAWD